MGFRVIIGAAFALGVCLLPGGAGAQVCDDDAGAVCEEDAGLDDADAGLEGPADAGVDAGGREAACSCDARSDEGGAIHVCTGSFDELTCDWFSCERGDVWARPCRSDAVLLCCDMPERKLYANLYADCTHPNCRQGFIAQCRDFGGKLHKGACPQQLAYEERNPEPDPRDDDDGGFCSVSRGVGGAGGGPASTGTALLLSLGLLGLRVRSRAGQRRTA